MYLYRGINEYDMKNIKDNGNMYCNLKRYSKDNLKYAQKIKEIENGNMGLSLDRVIGHINGRNLNSSVWISASSDFNFVASEYTIPQNGTYNRDMFRKEIALIDVDKNIKINKDIYVRSKNMQDYCGKYIDLGKDKLNDYYQEYFIKPLSLNPESYYYNLSRDLKILSEGKLPKITGFNNFATAASENLFLCKIDGSNIKKILSPLLQDIIYDETYNLDSNNLVEKVIDRTIERYNDIDEDIYKGKYNFSPEEQNLYNYLYVKNENGTYNPLINLVPVLYDKGVDIVILYDCLKEIKKSLISKIVKKDSKDINIVDDSVFVINRDYEEKKQLPNLRKITKKNQHDIIYKTDKNKVLMKYKI